MLDAIDRHDHAALREELGDFMFEAVFLAQLEAEAGHFTIADSLKSVADKLVRRHPHVFARDAGRGGARHAPARCGRAGRRSRRRSGARAASAAKPKTPAERHRAGAAGAAARLPDRHPRRVGRLRLGDGRRCRRQDPGGGRRAARGRRRARRRSITSAPRRRWATCCSRSPTCRASSGIEPETALRKANDKFTRRFTSDSETIGRRVGASDEGHDARRARSGVADGSKRSRAQMQTTKTRRARRTRRRHRSQARFVLSPSFSTSAR